MMRVWTEREAPLQHVRIFNKMNTFEIFIKFGGANEHLFDAESKLYSRSVFNDFNNDDI